MGVLRRRTGMAMSIAAMTIATALSTPTYALAASHETAGVDVEKSSDRPLTGTSDGSRGVSPAGCRVKANNPHVSTSQATRGDIKGYARSKCDDYVAELGIKTTVWRKRWWGYQKMGATGKDHAYGASKIGRSGRWNDCEVNSWRTVGYGWSIEDGEKYDAETMNYKNIRSCDV
jgi:hypothetical protein